MTEKLYLISPMPPSVNHYTSVRTIIKNGKPLSMVYETKEAKLSKSGLGKQLNINHKVSFNSKFYRS